MWQQGREEVLGKGVHGNTLPVDDLTETTEGTRCTEGETRRDKINKSERNKERHIVLT